MLRILQRPSIHDAFDLDREPPAVRDAYGRDRHGQSTLLGRRLIEAGARFVTVYWGKEMQDWGDDWKPLLANNPWDTHRNHFPLIKDSLLPRADRTLAALLADLSDRGMLDDTLVLWMGEFGRSPKISSIFSTPGREHWPHAFTILMAGAGIRGGNIYGATDRDGLSRLSSRRHRDGLRRLGNRPSTNRPVPRRSASPVNRPPDCWPVLVTEFRCCRSVRCRNQIISSDSGPLRSRSFN